MQITEISKYYCDTNKLVFIYFYLFIYLFFFFLGGGVKLGN